MKKILQKDAPVLREIAKEIHAGTIASSKIKKIVTEMKEALDSQDDGVAIAAPQIGYPLRIFVVSKKVDSLTKKTKKNGSEKIVQSGTSHNQEDSVYINPEIKKLSKDKKSVEEGCLSVRFLYGKVIRASKATVTAYDETGKKFTKGASGLLAQIFQHEVDHLNGILFIDKAKNLEEIQPEKVSVPWAFFGTSRFSVLVLDELKSAGFLPSLIVTAEDKPKGRRLILTPPEVKIWAEENNIPYIQPKTLRTREVAELIKSFATEGFDFFAVASYGKILPKEILDIPKKGVLNVHPSLLPKFRGPSPIQSAILSENETGVTIIKLDEQVDHGPILAQIKVSVPEWPPYEEDLENILGKEGGKLLAEILPDYMLGKTAEKEQDHSIATFSRKIEKSDGEINLSDDAETNLRKILAYHAWPGAYFFHGGKRIIVKRAHIENGKLVFEQVVPEGRKEMPYQDFLKGKR